MLTFFRKALSSWVVLAILGLVLVAFVITGIGDPFGGAGARGVIECADGQRVCCLGAACTDTLKGARAL